MLSTKILTIKDVKREDPFENKEGKKMYMYEVSFEGYQHPKVCYFVGMKYIKNDADLPFVAGRKYEVQFEDIDGKAKTKIKPLREMGANGESVKSVDTNYKISHAVAREVAIAFIKEYQERNSLLPIPERTLIENMDYLTFHILNKILAYSKTADEGKMTSNAMRRALELICISGDISTKQLFTFFIDIQLKYTQELKI